MGRQQGYAASWVRFAASLPSLWTMGEARHEGPPATFPPSGSYGRGVAVLLLRRLHLDPSPIRARRRKGGRGALVPRLAHRPEGGEGSGESNPGCRIALLPAHPSRAIPACG